MVSNIPTILIVAGLVALIALPFVVVACSVCVADRVVRALRAIYRLQKEQAAAAQRSAAPIPAPMPADSALAPAAEVAASVAPADARLEVQWEQVAVSQAPAQAPAAVSLAETQAVASTLGSAAADSNPDALAEPRPTEQTRKPNSRLCVHASARGCSAAELFTAWTWPRARFPVRWPTRRAFIRARPIWVQLGGRTCAR